MVLTLNLAAFVGFVVSGLAGRDLSTETLLPPLTARGPTAPRAFVTRPPVMGCRWQRDAASGRLSARWMT